MTPEQTAAFLISRSACAMISAMGMQAENQIRSSRGETPAYDDDAFEAVIVSQCIYHNAALDTLT